MTPPRRGEVWLVDLGMAAKVRPALVISIPAEDTDRAFVTLVPHTTSPRQSRFEAVVSVSFLRVGEVIVPLTNPRIYVRRLASSDCAI